MVREIASLLATGGWTADVSTSFAFTRGLKPDALAGLVAEARATRVHTAQVLAHLDVSDPARRRMGCLQQLAEVAAEARAARDFGPAVTALRVVLEYIEPVARPGEHPAPETQQHTASERLAWIRDTVVPALEAEAAKETMQ